MKEDLVSEMANQRLLTLRSERSPAVATAAIATVVVSIVVSSVVAGNCCVPWSFDSAVGGHWLFGVAPGDNWNFSGDSVINGSCNFSGVLVDIIG